MFRVWCIRHDIASRLQPAPAPGGLLVTQGRRGRSLALLAQRVVHRCWVVTWRRPNRTRMVRSRLGPEGPRRSIEAEHLKLVRSVAPLSGHMRQGLVANRFDHGLVCTISVANLFAETSRCLLGGLVFFFTAGVLSSCRVANRPDSTSRRLVQEAKSPDRWSSGVPRQIRRLAPLQVSPRVLR